MLSLESSSIGLQSCSHDANCYLQDFFALRFRFRFRFRVRCMSSSADIEASVVEVGGESKLHEDLSKVHRHIGCCNSQARV